MDQVEDGEDEDDSGEDAFHVLSLRCVAGGHRASTAQSSVTLATMLRHEDGAFGTARRLAACALGERDVVCRAEGILRGFHIGQ